MYSTLILVLHFTCTGHCSNPLVCRSSAVLSSWVSSATVVVSSTTASTATSVHQRPLPCRHHRFRFSDQTTDYTIGKKSLRSPFSVKFSLHRTSHAPPRATRSFCVRVTRLQLPPRASVPLLMSALGDVICHVIATSFADVIHHVVC